MTLYELNQAGYAAMPEMTEDKVKEKTNELWDWFNRQIGVIGQDKYFMLLNNDLHYYTIFAWKIGFASELADEVISIVKELGTLKSIELNDNGAWEFWITSQDATNVYHLFNYTRGVIEV